MEAWVNDVKYIIELPPERASNPSRHRSQHWRSASSSGAHVPRTTASASSTCSSRPTERRAPARVLSRVMLEIDGGQEDAADRDRDLSDKPLELWLPSRSPEQIKEHVFP